MRLSLIRFCLLVAVLISLADSGSAQAADDILIADFEANTYGDWMVEGESFGAGPAKGALPGQMAVSGFEGKGLVNSFTGGDGTAGRLTSPQFAIQRSFINFLIGGGDHPGETCINLKVDGKVVRSSTGPNNAPGGSEQLEWAGWDVRELVGDKAVIEIVDTHTGGWGHINVDQIVQSDKTRATAPRERSFVVDKRYLLLPVKTGAKKHRMQIVEGDKVIRDFEIEMAEDEADLMAVCDLAEFHGRTMTARVDRLAESSTALDRLSLRDEQPKDSQDIQAARPAIHFTAPRGWLNDPNGLVHVEGVWHLFYQHNPYGWGWGNMHWGHATSKDLLHWEHQPIALTPRQFGDWAFSGSAVIDTDNTSGWKTGKNPLMVAAYTSTGRGECIVYSNDLGQTWTEFEGNPVVKHQGRDPRLLWHAPTKRWVMAVYNESEGKRWIAFHTSPDLKKWEYASKIEGYFECPDIFELPVEGKPGQSKWVLYAADGEYALGNFDGREFKPDGPKQRLWHGNFYAAQTFSNVADGRRIQIGWGQGIEFPGKPFNQQMTIPVELKLQGTKDGVRMTALPVHEVDTVLSKSESVESSVSSDSESTAAGLPQTQDITLEIARPSDGTMQVEIFGEPIVIDFGARTLKVCEVASAPYEISGDILRLRVLADRGSLEVFVGEGTTAISAKARPRTDAPALKIRRPGSPMKVKAKLSYADG
jgi:fructan beta-fructosidase